VECLHWQTLGTNAAFSSVTYIYADKTNRGGAEYGEKWHEGGIKEKKQNVFDDFAAAAE